MGRKRKSASETPKKVEMSPVEEKDLEKMGNSFTLVEEEEVPERPTRVEKVNINDMDKVVSWIRSSDLMGQRLRKKLDFPMRGESLLLFW